MAKLQVRRRRIFSLALAVSLAAAAATMAQTQAWKGVELARPFPEPASEQQLIEALRSAPPEEKVIACKQLAIYGGKAAVPELAKLLDDERFSSWARIALEAIPDPSSEAALIAAAGELDGKLLVGVINSIGVKRAAQAVGVLTARLDDSDERVASAAAIALGKIGGDDAIHALHQKFHSAKPAIRSAIAEAGILCAEQFLADGDTARATEIYDVIRQADLPKQRIVEATRGAILARGDEGIPLLVEQLQSSDRDFFRIALSTARELPGTKVVEALSAQLADAAPERAALILYAIGDRDVAVVPPAVLEAAKSDRIPVQMAAIEVLGRVGDASVVPTLLEIAAEPDEKLSQGAMTALAGLAGSNVDKEIAARLLASEGRSQLILIRLIGERRIDATEYLVTAVKHSDREIRHAALTALGATASPEDLSVLITETIHATDKEDADIAWQALEAASVRMPDREATAAELAAAMSREGVVAEPRLLRILGAMGGATALENVAAAAKSDNEQLQDAGTRVLGEWMNADAAEPLYEIASSEHPYKTRALRGYLRIARQFKLPDDERIAMVRRALAIAERAEERDLALDVLKRFPSPEGVELAGALLDDAELRERAVEAAIFIGEKIKETNPAAAKSAGQKALQADPSGELAERAQALAKP